MLLIAMLLIAMLLLAMLLLTLLVARLQGVAVRHRSSRYACRSHAAPSTFDVS